MSNFKLCTLKVSKRGLFLFWKTWNKNSLFFSERKSQNIYSRYEPMTCGLFKQALSNSIISKAAFHKFYLVHFWILFLKHILRLLNIKAVAFASILISSFRCERQIFIFFPAFLFVIGKLVPNGIKLMR